MQRRGSSFSLMAAALAGASPAGAAETAAVLPATSPWNVDYADDSCALRRSFGDGEKSAVFEIRQFVPSVMADFTIAANGIGISTRQAIQLHYEPESRPRIEGRSLRVILPQFYRGYAYNDALTPIPPGSDPKTYVPATDPERGAWESSIRAVTVTSGFDRRFTLATGPLHRPLEALRACMDELLTHWGIDVAAHKTMTKGVEAIDMPDLTAHLLAAYPSYQLDTGKSGTVRLRLMIDAQGKPTACHIQMKAKDDAFETTACRKFMTYGKFRPALDKDGKPMASYFVNRVIYLTN